MSRVARTAISTRTPRFGEAFIDSAPTIGTAALIPGMSINQPRKPAGAPSGGQWSAMQHAEIEGIELTRPVQQRLPGTVRTVTDVLGRSRDIVRTYEDGAYDCPFCAYPVQPGQPHCENPACPANQRRDAAQVAAQVAAAEARQAETERRQREHEAAMSRLEASRNERQRRLADLEARARGMGACLTCLQRSAWDYKPRFVKHRSKCPHERS